MFRYECSGAPAQFYIYVLYITGDLRSSSVWLFTTLHRLVQVLFNRISPRVRNNVAAPPSFYADPDPISGKNFKTDRDPHPDQDSCTVLSELRIYDKQSRKGLSSVVFS
jgi:hypothetical protein